MSIYIFSHLLEKILFCAKSEFSTANMGILICRFQFSYLESDILSIL